MVTSDSSKLWPTSVGTSSPTAGSSDAVARNPPVSGNSGRSSPEICTVAFSWVAFWAAS
ncbi:MAG: hypothetical protein M5U19_05800 [Microthrixaceae bacterium]|nr:hypothetical protein [Microthrixaceae bacterium]